MSAFFDKLRSAAETAAVIKSNEPGHGEKTDVESGHGDNTGVEPGHGDKTDVEPGHGDKAGVEQVEGQNPKVEYQPPPAINLDQVEQLGQRLHRLTVNEMRQELKGLHLDHRGTRAVIRRRLRDHHRRQALVAARGERRNKAERFFDYFLVIDFECTCEDEIFDYEHEIIEFPIVVVSVAEKRVVDEFRVFIRPLLNPILSDFCTKLTGISQAEVDEAQPFPAVLDYLRSWMNERRFIHDGFRYAFVTDGPWDLAKFFQMQCYLSGFDSIPHDFRYWINIRKAFIHKYNPNGQIKLNLAGMLGQLKMEFIGRQHSGIDDARNIARILIRLMDDGAPLRINEHLIRNHKSNETTTIVKKREEKERQLWKDHLPFKVVSLSREQFIIDAHLDCDSCDESG